MAVGTSSFSLNQEVELSRNTVAATAAKFEDCDRAVNAANDESRSLASKFRRLEGISTQLFEILKGQAAKIDRLKGIVLRLSGDPNQQSQGSCDKSTEWRWAGYRIGEDLMKEAAYEESEEKRYAR